MLLLRRTNMPSDIETRNGCYESTKAYIEWKAEIRRFCRHWYTSKVLNIVIVRRTMNPSIQVEKISFLLYTLKPSYTAPYITALRFLV